MTIEDGVRTLTNILHSKRCRWESGHLVHLEKRQKNKTYDER